MQVESGMQNRPNPARSALIPGAALPRGYATILLSLTGAITRLKCHPDDERAFGDVGLHEGAVVTTLALGIDRGAIEAMVETTDTYERDRRKLWPKAAKLKRGGLAPHVLRRIELYLDERLPEAVSLSTLATIAGLSVSHFAREFKRSLGFAPCHFIQRRRLQLAADVIVKTARPLADVALEMGFADQSHFSRSFARAFGTTPRDFRRAYTVAEHIDSERGL